MEFKLFIPAAGTGSRLGETCRHLNKSLVSVAHRPAICHIIEQFGPEVPVVVALGYKGELVREFLGLAYPQRTFEFVEVAPSRAPAPGWASPCSPAGSACSARSSSAPATRS